MCLPNTDRRTFCARARIAAAVVAVALLAGAAANAQSLKLDWRRIGNTALDLSLAGVATGPVDRVWYSSAGDRLFARTASGRVFVTQDFEKWSEAPAGTEAPAALDGNASRRPESSARIRSAAATTTKVYAFGTFAYRSDDGGSTWTNVTRYRTSSLLGDGLADLAVSPRDPDEVAVAAATGVWRSVDGGLSWTGLNESLPNFPADRILGLPAGSQGAKVAAGTGAWEWNPGEKQAWRISGGPELNLEQDLKTTLSAILGAQLTAVAMSGDYIYAGSADGQLWTSADRGRTWTRSPDTFSTAVTRIWVDAREPRLALAALGEQRAAAAPNAKPGRLLRTINAGGFWDDLTANLPSGAVRGVAADRATGAIYAATERGLFLTYGNLTSAGPATPWTAIADSVPPAPVMDVTLDAGGNQLYALFQGYGVYAAPAPHRARDPRVVSAADLASRAAAPGALLSILGANLRAAQAGDTSAPVLASGDGKTEIQVPFNVAGSTLPVIFDGANGQATIGMPLRPTAPGIFVDRDGTPMILDGDSGVLLDAMTPAHSNARVQVLATGLGRVRPDWPAGMAAPADNPPRVIANVKAYLDREPVEVTRAVLAPGYVGFYLVEIQLPNIVNYGPAEVYIEADGQASNRVRLYIEP